MQTIRGTDDAPSLDANVLTVAGEVVQARVPAVPPAVCPHCARELYEASPLTIRGGLLRQLEAYSSSGPGGRPPEQRTGTGMRELCRAVYTAPEGSLVLEDTPYLTLRAAVLANSFGFRDWVQELLEEYVESAVKVKPEAAAAGAQE